MKQINNHYEFIDFLRVSAIIAVILQHAATAFIELESLPADDYEIVLSNQSISRLNILPFIFISGFLLIPRQITPRLIWVKYIKRIAITFLCWSFLYSVYNLLINYLHNDGFSLAFLAKYFISDLVSGGTRRMWYLVMLMGLYALIPVFSKIYGKEDGNYSMYLYLTGLVLLVSIVLPTILIGPIETIFGLDYLRIQHLYPSYMVFYCLLGGGGRIFLHRIPSLSKSIRLLIYIMALAAALIIIMMTLRTNELPEQSNVCYVIMVLALILYSLTGYINWSDKLKHIIKDCAECTFGIYLVHTFVEYALQRFGFREILVANCHPIFYLSLYAFIVLALSWLITKLIRKTSLGVSIT